MTWEQAAKMCEEIYGSYVNYEVEERYFVCPECEDMIYEMDYDDSDDLSMCPICGFEWEE